MSPFARLSGAGFLATAITYGPARIGFGLFVPQFRESFGLGTQTVGWISSAGFLGFLLSLPLADLLQGKWGPRAPVGVSLATATVGMGLVAAAQSVLMLAIGVFLAMASAGLSWAPFNAAVRARVDESWRPAALARVSTGTTFGIIAAGALAMTAVLSGLDWRMVWTIFALAAFGALVLDWPGMSIAAWTPNRARDPGWAPLFNLSATTLYLAGFVFGVGSAIYISLAADQFTGSGSLPGLPVEAIPALVFLSYGFGGACGLLTDRARDKLGLVLLVRLLFAASAMSLAMIWAVPNSWAGVLGSAGLQGLTVMMLSAVFAMWSDALFPDLSTRAMTALLITLAAGSVIGPAAAGAMLTITGPAAVFLGTAGLLLAAGLFLGPRTVTLDPLTVAQD